MDLAITWDINQGDLVLGAWDLETDSGLRGAVAYSLATDRLADEDDDIPDGTTDRRGSWQDGFLDVPGDLEGSKLWLRRRLKDVPETYFLVNEDCQQALQWLIDDGIASQVLINSYRVSFGILGITAQIFKPGTTQPVNIALQFAWEGF